VAAEVAAAVGGGAEMREMRAAIGMLTAQLAAQLAAKPAAGGKPGRKRRGQSKKAKRAKKVRPKAGAEGALGLAALTNRLGAELGVPPELAGPALCMVAGSACMVVTAMLSIAGGQRR
jgi:hypothetical protein